MCNPDNNMCHSNWQREMYMILPILKVNVSSVSEGPVPRDKESSRREAKTVNKGVATKQNRSASPN